MTKSLPKFITPEEFKALKSGAKKTKYPVRNELILTMLYQHGLRETELCRLRTDQIDLEQADFHVERIKDGKNTTHPLTGQELRLIKRYQRFKVGKAGSSLPFLFVSSWGNQLCRDTVAKTVQACAIEGGIKGKKISPHMLRHGCGYKMVNIDNCHLRIVQDYLGHKDIRNTVIYTELSGNKFKGIWG